MKNGMLLSVVPLLWIHFATEQYLIRPIFVIRSLHFH